MLKKPFGYAEQLPENMRDPFMWLCQDVAGLQRKWDFYLALFGTSQNTDLLSELARVSFNIIFETLENDIKIAICKLSDPTETKRQTNLSFQTLVKNFPEIEGLDRLVAHFQDICKSIRQQRHKRIVHRDLNTVIKPLENPLPGVSAQEIDTIVKEAGIILNYVWQNDDDSELHFHVTSPGGGNSLIFWLQRAKLTKSKVGHNFVYFEAASMRELSDSMETWQDEHGMHFRSVNIQKEGEKLCCIAFLNSEQFVQKPMEKTADVMQNMKLIAYEEAMERFQRKALRIIVKENNIGAYVEFVNDAIPPEKIREIQSRLKQCTTALEIREVFGEERLAAKSNS